MTLESVKSINGQGPGIYMSMGEAKYAYSLSIGEAGSSTSGALESSTCAATTTIRSLLLGRAAPVLEMHPGWETATPFAQGVITPTVPEFSLAVRLELEAAAVEVEVGWICRPSQCFWVTL